MNLVRLLLALCKSSGLDATARFEALRQAGKRLVPEYRFTWPQMAWWHDREFNAYLEWFGEREGLNDDRRWMLGQVMRLVAAVPGDTAECGAYRGAGSFLICRINAAQSGGERRHFVFDSFEGLSAPTALDGAHWSRGDLACAAAEVRRALAEFPAVSLHPGWIPERFADVADRRFAFVHIDVDLYEPTRDSLAFFYPRMSEGGVVLCDDYGFTSCPGATRAVDEFLADRPEKMIALSCGGGFLIKGVSTSGRIAPLVSGEIPGA
jgi:O-methyltransferase